LVNAPIAAVRSRVSGWWSVFNQSSIGAGLTVTNNPIAAKSAAAPVILRGSIVLKP
jgi:hypothetical protein